MMNAKQLQVQGDECNVKLFKTAHISIVCLLDDQLGYLATPPGTGVKFLQVQVRPRVHLIWTRNQRASAVL